MYTFGKKNKHVTQSTTLLKLLQMYFDEIIVIGYWILESQISLISLISLLLVIKLPNTLINSFIF